MMVFEDHQNVQDGDIAKANVDIKSITLKQAKANATRKIKKDIKSKDTKVSADAFEALAQKVYGGTLIKPNQSPLDVAGPLGEVKFKSTRNIRGREILGKLFRDSLKAEPGATGKRNRRFGQSYKTPKPGEVGDFGGINLIFTDPWVTKK